MSVRLSASTAMLREHSLSHRSLSALWTGVRDLRAHAMDTRRNAHQPIFSLLTRCSYSEPRR